MPSLILSLLFSWIVFADDAQVTLLTGRSQSQLVRDQLIFNETKEIRLSTFEFHLDEHGKRTLGYLVDAAQRGVKVKIILDDFHDGLVKNKALLKALVAQGIEIKIYNPVFRKLLSINNRTHMKSLITSDSMVIGDRNMGQAYFAKRNGNTYISTDVLITEPKNQKVAIDHFDDFFKSSRSLDLAGTVPLTEIYVAEKELKEWARAAIANHRAPPKLKTHTVPDLRYFADNPEPSIHSKSGINKEVLAMLRRAEKTLTIMNPYVFMTPELKNEFEAAIKRGVKITIMSNSSATTDQKITALAWEHSRNEIAKLGIELFELEKGSFIHAKTIVRDGKEVFIGSYNLDPRSQNLNVENGVFFEDQKVARDLTAHTTRIQKKMMTKVEPVDMSKMTVKERASHCMRSGLRRMILAPIYFAL